MSDVAKRSEVASHDLQILVSSASLQEFNRSSPGKRTPQESMVFEELRRQKRASLRRLTNKVISKRQPNSLRDDEGQQVEDQSRWGGTVHEHLKNKSDDAANPETTRRIWRSGVWAAIQNGYPRGAEFQEAMKLVKPNVATGTILLFLLEATQIL